MRLYVLDTDHVTLLRKGNAEIVARVAATLESDIAITIITIEEQFRGLVHAGSQGTQCSTIGSRL